MSTKQILLDHLVRKNKSVLDFYRVTLLVDDLNFGEPEPGNYDGLNTRIPAMMRPHHKVRGGHIYYYSRHDMQEAFATIGLDTVPCAVVGDVDLGKVLNELRYRYNFDIDPNEVIDVQQEGDQYSFGVTSKSLIWLNRLTVTIVEAYEMPLDVAFPNNVLDGLIPPDYSA